MRQRNKISCMHELHEIPSFLFYPLYLTCVLGYTRGCQMTAVTFTTFKHFSSLAPHPTIEPNAPVSRTASCAVMPNKLN
jgi:hypothetical protein